MSSNSNTYGNATFEVDGVIGLDVKVGGSRVKAAVVVVLESATKFILDTALDKYTSMDGGE